MEETAGIAPPVVGQHGISISQEVSDGRKDRTIPAANDHQQWQAVAPTLEVEVSAINLKRCPLPPQ